MKNIIFTLSLILLTSTYTYSAEISCVGMKKLSKEYISCKAGNLKKALSNKSKKSSNKTESSSNKNKKVKDSAKKVGEGAKKFGNKIKDASSGIGKFLGGFGPKKENK